MANNQKLPYLPDIKTLLSAGINPKTGLPEKKSKKTYRKDDIKRAIQILDEQNAINRYQWYNLPCDLSSQDLERMIYYKGQLCFFYLEDLDKFFFMPYALNGGIDFYGRFLSIHPVPFSGGTSEKEKDEIAKQRNYLSTLKLDVLYDIPIDFVDPRKNCVLIHDYSKQISQTIVSRSQIQDTIIDIMSDCIPFMRTAILNSTGIKGMRVSSEDEQSNVLAANDSIDRAALNGEKYIPIVGNLEFQDLAEGPTLKSEEFMIAMQSLDNFRLSLYGLENGGLFQKKSHMLEAEQAMNAGIAKSPLNDGLAIRQKFCDIVNAVWGVGISCELSESAINADNNNNGIISDEHDQSGIPGDQGVITDDV